MLQQPSHVEALDYDLVIKRQRSGNSTGSMHMRLTSTTDKGFLETLEGWLDSQSETMVLIRYSHAAGNKSFEFFTSFAALSERLHQLRPKTCITAFRRPQLPLRGVVDDGFIDVCLRNIPDGSEFVVVETVPRTTGQYSWFHDEAGETHKELRESLEASRGSPSPSANILLGWKPVLM